MVASRHGVCLDVYIRTPNILYVDALVLAVAGVKHVVPVAASAALQTSMARLGPKPQARPTLAVSILSDGVQMPKMGTIVFS